MTHVYTCYVSLTLTWLPDSLFTLAMMIMILPRIWLTRRILAMTRDVILHAATGPIRMEMFTANHNATTLLP